MKNKYNKIVFLLMFFTIIFTIAGSTLAYWNWQTTEAQRTQVTFTVTQDFSCAADGGGSITSGDAFIAPTTCTNTQHAIQREVTVMPTLNRNNLTINMILNLDVNFLTSGLSNSQNFKYALTESSTSCETGVISSGNFNGKTTGNKIEILNKSYDSSTPKTYYLYIWLDKAETSASTMDQSFNLSISGSCTDEVKPPFEEPKLDDGMIPVTIANNGTVTTIKSNDSNWYDYNNKEWANVVLVNNTSRSTYKNTTGVTVNQSDILAYYVWIPRYKYKIWTTTISSTGNEQEIDIEFEKVTDSISNGTTVDSWKTHPAFIWDGNPIAGIWVGKFETGHSTLSSSTTNNNLNCTNENCPNADGLIIKPNVTSLRYNSISKQFYASRSMTRSGNPFGLSVLSTDTHLMKNSEWGAVAYLSHSKYGITGKIRYNNNDNHTTGCGASSATTSNSSSCTLAYGSGISSYPQSTTGNITGIFDMAGGSWEYVMGNFNNTTNYNFTTLASSKYYDVYLATQFTGNFLTNMSLCTIETCGGHALFETANWYSNGKNFVTDGSPWFLRGGYYFDGSYTSVWGSSYDNGRAYSEYSFRTVAIVGA